MPCDPVSFRPIKDKVAGSAAVKLDQALRQPAQAQSGDAKTKKKREKKDAGKPQEVVNLWRDISSSPLGESGEWKEYAAYRNQVQVRVVDILRRAVCSKNNREKQ